MWRIDMRLSDYAIMAAITKLQLAQGDFTMVEVAKEVGCNERTVRRAIARLRAAQQIVVHVTPGRNRSFCDLRRSIDDNQS